MKDFIITFIVVLLGMALQHRIDQIGGVKSSTLITPKIKIDTSNIDGIIKSDTTYIYKEK